MRALFWLLLLAGVIWMISRHRRATPPSPASDTPTPARAQDMVACAHCGVHLPKREAVQGARGLYCSTEHRSAAQDHHPD